MKKGSLSKLKAWQKLKREILSKMDKTIVTPERANKILNFIKLTLKNVTTMEDLGLYCAMLAKRFPELEKTIEGFKLEEEEKLDEAVSLVIDKLMTEGHFENAEKLINKLSEIKNTDEKIKTVKNFCPKEFEEIYKRIFKTD